MRSGKSFKFISGKLSPDRLYIKLVYNSFGSTWFELQSIVATSAEILQRKDILAAPEFVDLQKKEEKRNKAVFIHLYICICVHLCIHSTLKSVFNVQKFGRGAAKSEVMWKPSTFLPLFLKGRKTLFFRAALGSRQKRAESRVGPQMPMSPHVRRLLCRQHPARWHIYYHSWTRLDVTVLRVPLRAWPPCRTVCGFW